MTRNLQSSSIVWFDAGNPMESGKWKVDRDGDGDGDGYLYGCGRSYEPQLHLSLLTLCEALLDKSNCAPVPYPSFSPCIRRSVGVTCLPNVSCRPRGTLSHDALTLPPLFNGRYIVEVEGRSQGSICAHSFQLSHVGASSRAESPWCGQT